MNLTSAEARRRFAAARSARLATADAAGRPHIVPVVFACADDRVYIAIDAKPKRSTDLKRLRNIQENPNVALLADDYDDDWSQLWWVRADGSARILPAADDGDDGKDGKDGDADESARRVPIELLQRRYPQYVADVPRGPVIEISVIRWTGWAFAETPA
jgi:PPOX class probable F420-dependent enzyme